MKFLPWIILSAVALSLPLFISEYTLHLLILILLSAYLGQSWNVIGGYGGQLSLGHSLFFGAGAYSYAILTTNYHSPAVGAILFGILIAFVLALIIGLSTFSYGLKDIYFVMATIAFAEIVRIIMLNAPHFGAAQGVMLPFDSSSIWLTSKKLYYYTILLLLVGLTVWLKDFTRRSVGLSLRVLRENEDIAEASGVDVYRIKVLALVISSVFTSVGGMFQAKYLLYIHPDTFFGLPLSTQIAAVAIVGGRKNISGPIVGAFLLIPIAEYSRAMVGVGGRGVHQIMYGLAIIVASLFFANGIAPTLENLISSLRGRYGRVRPA